MSDMTTPGQETACCLAEIDETVVHLSPTGELKKGRREPGDIIVIEYAALLTFFEINERHNARYITSLSRFVR